MNFNHNHLQNNLRQEIALLIVPKYRPSLLKNGINKNCFR